MCSFNGAVFSTAPRSFSHRSSRVTVTVGRVLTMCWGVALFFSFQGLSGFFWSKSVLLFPDSTFGTGQETTHHSRIPHCLSSFIPQGSSAAQLAVNTGPINLNMPQHESPTSCQDNLFLELLFIATDEHRNWPRAFSFLETTSKVGVRLLHDFWFMYLRRGFRIFEFRLSSHRTQQDACVLCEHSHLQNDCLCLLCGPLWLVERGLSLTWGKVKANVDLLFRVFTTHFTQHLPLSQTANLTHTVLLPKE